MRSYIKAYQKGTVFYPELGLVPGSPDAIWAILRPRKQGYLDMINYNYNTYVNFSYFGTDPSLGVPLAASSIGSFITFEDYSLHPID
jgi:hypothetical protein